MFHFATPQAWVINKMRQESRIRGECSTLSAIIGDLKKICF
jgi:hypothetical protein